MRRLAFSREAAKFVIDLDAKRFKQVFVKLLALAEDPLPPDSQSLKGFDARRADIGEYRIVYTFTDDDLDVVLIGKRNDDEVYRNLRRLS